MNLRVSIRVLAFTFIFSTACLANEFKIKSSEWDTEETKNFLTIGGEVSSFASNTSRFSGYGAKFGFQHAFARKWAIGTNIVQAYGLGQSAFSTLYTAINGSLIYAIWGGFITEKKTLRLNRQRVFHVETPLPSTFAVKIDGEQVFLNGSEQVFSASGFSLGVQYRKSLLGVNWMSEVKFGQLESQSDIVNATMFGLSVVWGF